MAINSAVDSKNTLYCSFCGKSQHEVRKLIAGPTVFICDECVELVHGYHPRRNQNAGLKAATVCRRPTKFAKFWMTM